MHTCIRHEGLAMARPIRKTTFTWNPAHESRATVWNRIKAHIQQELDRIRADYMLARRTARRQAHPGYAQNQRIVMAARQGVSNREIAHQFGLSHQRVREILRSEARWSARNGRNHTSGHDRHPAQQGWTREREVAGAFPRTTAMLSDP
jgi:hypothetical protein